MPETKIIPDLSVKSLSGQIEDIITKRAVDASLKPLSRKTYLDIAKDTFLLDTPFVSPMSPFGKVVVIGANKVTMSEAKAFLKKVTQTMAGKGPIISDTELADMFARFGREDANYHNITNLESAIIIFLTTTKLRKKELFTDGVLITLTRLYFASLVAELLVAERFLTIMGERGAFEARHINQIQDKYAKLVSERAWVKRYNKIVDRNDQLPVPDKTDKVKDFRNTLKDRFVKGKTGFKSGFGSAKSIKKLLLAVERASAAMFSDIILEHPVRRTIGKKKVMKQKMVWVKEGDEAIKTVNNALKHKTVLTNDEFLVLCKKIGKPGLNLTGIQSAMMDILGAGETSGKNIPEIIATQPLFSNFLRLYFATLIMKLGVTELLELVFQKKNDDKFKKLFERMRSNFLVDDFNPLVDAKSYTELVQDAQEEGSSTSTKMKLSAEFKKDKMSRQTEKDLGLRE
ncbi:MAG: hypothetical protein QF475_02125 [Candidatus Undinarchaeales archaeon]|jgi:hypothetical protein|nr:hypothetical protein [Candidatus Undinarchaeales archaeon]